MLMLRKPRGKSQETPGQIPFLYKPLGYPREEQTQELRGG